MTQKEFLIQIEKTFAQCLELVERKNIDYAGQNSDPFKNLNELLKAGVPVERAILVRIYDKLSRISSLLDNEAKVDDEKMEDTINDAINYLAILKTYIS